MKTNNYNKRFLHFTTSTMNGEVYKNEKAFEEKTDQVCYISEYGLRDLEEADHEMTDEEIISKGIGESYWSILEQCQEKIEEMKEDAEEFEELYGELNAEHLAQMAFEICDWQYVSTYLAEIDY